MVKKSIRSPEVSCLVLQFITTTATTTVTATATATATTTLMINNYYYTVVMLLNAVIKKKEKVCKIIDIICGLWLSQDFLSRNIERLSLINTLFLKWQGKFVRMKKKLDFLLLKKKPYLSSETQVMTFPFASEMKYSDLTAWLTVCHSNLLVCVLGRS